MLACKMFARGDFMESGKIKIGGALMIKSLAEHKDWILEGQRDIELQDTVMPKFLDSDWKPTIHAVKDTLHGYTGRIGIHGPFIGVSLIAGFDPKIAEPVIARYLKALEIGTELGAEYMVIHSPFIGFGASPFSDSPLPKDSFNESAFARAILEPVLVEAEKQKCIIVVENIQDNNTVHLCTLVRSYNSEYLKVSIDVGHAFITHQHGGPTPDQWVRDAGPLLEHMHIQDSDGQTDRHWAPGFGSVNWNAIFEELENLKHAPRLILELRKHADLERGAKFLADRGYVQ